MALRQSPPLPSTRHRPSHDAWRRHEIGLVDHEHVRELHLIDDRDKRVEASQCRQAFPLLIGERKRVSDGNRLGDARALDELLFGAAELCGGRSRTGTADEL
jgi:hypothetical protein